MTAFRSFLRALMAFTRGAIESHFSGVNVHAPPEMRTSLSFSYSSAPVIMEVKVGKAKLPIVRSSIQEGTAGFPVFPVSFCVGCFADDQARYSEINHSSCPS